MNAESILPAAEPAEAPGEEEPLKRPPAAIAPLPRLWELRQAYETTQAAELAIGRQQARVRQRYTALVAQLKSVQHQARCAHDRGTAHQKLNAMMGLYDHMAELEATFTRLQRQRDVQALAVLATAAAYRECCDEAHRALTILRRARQAGAALPPALAALELDHALQAQTQLIALVGEAEAQALAADPMLRPGWAQRA
jgi:hypothetical protein